MTKAEAIVVEQTLRIAARPETVWRYWTDGDDTILALCHSGLPVAFVDEHRGGWGHFLPLLATAAGEGADG